MVCVVAGCQRGVRRGLGGVADVRVGAGARAAAAAAASAALPLQEPPVIHHTLILLLSFYAYTTTLQFHFIL
jgi:hypothetical protein